MMSSGAEIACWQKAWITLWPCSLALHSHGVDKKTETRLQVAFLWRRQGWGRICVARQWARTRTALLDILVCRARLPQRWHGKNSTSPPSLYSSTLDCYVCVLDATCRTEMSLHQLLKTSAYSLNTSEQWGTQMKHSQTVHHCSFLYFKKHLSMVLQHLPQKGREEKPKLLGVAVI